MLKRLLDIAVSASGLLLASPVLVPVMILVWLQDFHSPFYIASRIGKDGKVFKMVKMRSMVVNAEKTGVDSTSANDNRITAVGRFIRSYKIDEITQFWNVLKGNMSLVGPRPNVKRDVDLYTDVERKLLTVKPGVTDLASIVFSDEGDILKDRPDPDLSYNQLIRPWKSRLGLLYIEKRSFFLDVKLIALTAVAVLSKPKALEKLTSVLKGLNADERLIEVARRKEPLAPYPPPGSTEVVASRG